MSDDPTAAIRALHDTLTVSITTLEALACECAEMAHIAEQEGNQGFADALHIFSRRHRIRVLELAGKQAALINAFPNAFQPEE